jgi:hypothetical protein
MVEDTGLEVWRRGNRQWHDFPNKSHKTLLIASKVIRGTQTEEQAEC